MQSILSTVLLLSALVPTRTWYPPDQPVNVEVKAGGPATLALTDFTGRHIDPQTSPDVPGDTTVDLRTIFPINLPGTYVLYVVPRQERANGAGRADELLGRPMTDLTKFAGSPLVVSVRADERRGAPQGPMVTKVEPLRYAVMQTDAGPVTIGFFYNAAPHTVTNFLTLADQGFYDGLTFHRILPGYVLQGGDPRGDGTGGPGYRVQAEFSDVPHVEGILSMARASDPLEPSAPPRREFADTAGSQFFVALGDQAKTRTLDRRYTAFGRVVGGIEAVRQLGSTPLADPVSGRPTKPPVIQKIEVRLVTAQENPYTEILRAPDVQLPDKDNLSAGNVPVASPRGTPAKAVERLPDDQSSKARPGELQQGGNQPNQRRAEPPAGRNPR